MEFGASWRRSVIARWRSIGESGIRVARALIAEAQDAGELAPADSERLALVCFVSLHGAAMLAAGNLLDGTSVDYLTLATTDILWAGMVAGMPAPQEPGESEHEPRHEMNSAS